MMNKAKVLRVWYSNLHKCNMLECQIKNDTCYAAVAENLTVKKGDTVWILRNSELNYKGFAAV